MSNLENLFLKTISEHNMFSSGDRIVVGLSGGADSCVLLYVLNKFKSEFGIKIAAAHLNHGIRGQEALRDMQFADKFAKSLGVEFYSKIADVPLYAKENSLSEETAGRNLRYAFFDEICKNNNFNKIAVAHNENDRVETILMNLIRGCGANGLEGIKATNKNIIRPLININRTDIENYAKKNCIQYVTDSTNNENIYTRNLIRNKILPLMSDINSNVINNIIRTSDIVSEENTFIDEICNEKCSLYKTDNNHVYVNKETFCQLKPTEKRRIILMAINTLCGSVDNISFSQIQNALKTQETGKNFIFSNGVTLIFTANSLEFTKKLNVINSYCYEAKINETITVPETGLSYSITCAEKISKDKNTLYISADNIDLKNLKIRTKNDGDVFQPSGLDGRSKKVKKFFIDSKIPAGERNKYPLLVCNNEILAILPIRVSHKFLITNNTKRVIKISVK